MLQAHDAGSRFFMDMHAAHYSVRAGHSGVHAMECVGVSDAVHAACGAWRKPQLQSSAHVWVCRLSTTLSVQGILGSTSWNALVFLTLYMQLVGISKPSLQTLTGVQACMLSTTVCVGHSGIHSVECAGVSDPLHAAAGHVGHSCRRADGPVPGRNSRGRPAGWVRG